MTKGMTKREKKVLVQKVETLCQLLDERLDIEIFSNPVMCQMLLYRGFSNLPVVDPEKLEEKSAFIKRFIADIIEITDTTEVETFAFAQKLFGGEEICNQ